MTNNNAGLEREGNRASTASPQLQLLHSTSSCFVDLLLMTKRETNKATTEHLSLALLILAGYIPSWPPCTPLPHDNLLICVVIWFEFTFLS